MEHLISQMDYVKIAQVDRENQKSHKTSEENTNQRTGQ